jgi:hypothetical protein
VSNPERRPREPAASPDQRYRQIIDELERLVWHILRRPGVPMHLVKVWQISAAVEILPQVFANVAQVSFTGTAERHVRLWYQSISEDGSAVEVPLLTFHTETFPDPNAQVERQGMNLHAQWWEVVRQRLNEILAFLEPQGEMVELPEIAGEQSGALLGDREIPTGWSLEQIKAHLAQTSATLGALLTRPAQDRPMPRSTLRPSGLAGDAPIASRRMADTLSPLASAAEGRVLEELRRQLNLLFEESQQRRDEGYRERDTLEHKLRERYFLLHPVMKLAAVHMSGEATRDLVVTWAQQGCPPPDEAELPSSLSPLLGIKEGAERARQIGEMVAEARAITQELERAQLLVRERTAVLQRVCELSGGHTPKTDRDAQGAAQILCARCGAALSSQAPEQRDRWLN